jgi:hypothetical protein
LITNARGQQIVGPLLDADLQTRSVDLPLVRSQQRFRVFALDGRPLLDIPASTAAPNVRLIGTRIFITTDAAGDEWHQFNLTNGREGASCRGEGLGAYYVASDGSVAVALGDRSLVDGVDLDTCQVIWSIPGSGTNEAKEVWKVHTTLVQRTDDRLFSLVSPS